MWESGYTPPTRARPTRAQYVRAPVAIGVLGRDN